MSEYMFGICKTKPTLAQAKRRDQICKEEGGWGYTECNRRRGSSPGINHGEYQGWYSGPNRGNPFDDWLARAVLDRVDDAEGRPEFAVFRRGRHNALNDVGECVWVGRAPSAEEARRMAEEQEAPTLYEGQWLAAVLRSSLRGDDADLAARWLSAPRPW